MGWTGCKHEVVSLKMGALGNSLKSCWETQLILQWCLYFFRAAEAPGNLVGRWKEAFRVGCA